MRQVRPAGCRGREANMEDDMGLKKGGIRMDE